MKQVLFGLLFLACIPSVLPAAPVDDAFHTGMQLYREGRLEEAAKQFQAVIQMDPAHWRAYQGQGNAYYKLGYKYLALVSYEASLKANPDNQPLKAFVEKFRPAVLPAATVPPTAPAAAAQTVASAAPSVARKLKKSYVNMALQIGPPLIFGPKIGVSPVPQMMLSAGIIPAGTVMIYSFDLRLNLMAGKKRPYLVGGYDNIGEKKNSDRPRIDFPFYHFGAGYEHVAYSGFGIGFEVLAFQFKAVAGESQNTFTSTVGGNLNIRRYF